VFTRPDDLSDAQLIDVLGTSWGLRVDDLEYQAVGFGSHHWRATANGERWFVTVDDLEVKRRHDGEPLDVPLQRLSASLGTAWSLRQAGMDFVVAPVRTTAGAMVEAVGSRFAVALYPYIEGATYGWGSYPTRAERLAVLDELAQLHAATPIARPTAFIDDFEIAHRDQLVAALADLDRPWATGPFGEPARALVDLHAEAIREALRGRDRLAATAASQPGRMVITHGEPHRANTIVTPNGVVLIDWDTALISPPERDLWSFISEDQSIVEDYEARTGNAPRDGLLELYSLSWDIAEISVYVGEFRRTHDETEDTRLAWASLQRHLDPARW
jgi:spectinomycin phosphotransferase